jgi:hypothetical protein
VGIRRLGIDLTRGESCIKTAFQISNRGAPLYHSLFLKINNALKINYGNEHD